jgi:hypothetical protein
MKKISTLFKKDLNDLSRVTNEINSENQWVFDGEGIPTRKYDGTAAAIINGEIYKRYDVKKGRQVPANSISCQEPDLITGHHPHWVKCERNNPSDKYFFIAFDLMADSGNVEDGTYELIGEKVKNNPEKVTGHVLIRHGVFVLNVEKIDFDYLKDYLSDPQLDIEGIVFHHKNDGRMCKLRKSDFGIKR